MQTKLVNDENGEADSVERRARGRLVHDCPYAFCFQNIRMCYHEGMLVLRGRLPSFYLKQVLQTLLRDVEGVDRIDNRVDVVSATGLSSVSREESATHLV
jgi:hypothetical protein